MSNITVKFKKFSPEAIIPKYNHAGDSGLDLCVIDVITPLTYIKDCWDEFGFYYMAASEILTFTTGLGVEIPVGYEGQGRSRSGLACNKGLVVINSPGTIDSNYRGEIKVTLINLSKSQRQISKFDRVAQLVICPVLNVEIVEANDLANTTRGTGGYGSTGING